MEKFRLAVLGLNQGAKAARDAAVSDEFDLVAVAGFGEQAETIASELNVPLYSDYVELLENVGLDAVVIALPNGLHLPATEIALNQGIKNILLENRLRIQRKTRSKSLMHVRKLKLIY